MTQTLHPLKRDADGHDISRSGEAVVYQRAIERNDEDDDRWIDGQGWELLSPHP